MYSNYSKVAERLFAYRKALRKSQEEMGKELDVNQSHYCKLEDGSKIISYNSLKHFEENGGDIFYLLTGDRYDSGKMDGYIGKCKTAIGKAECLRMMLWLTKQGILLCENQDFRPLERAWKSVELAEQDREEASVWKSIRKVEGLTQEEMAGKLDITLKRYRRIEKLQVQPDAEVLNTLFCVLGYSPFVIFHREIFYTDEINRIWEEFPEEIRNPLEEVLQENLKFIEWYER